jgi:poly-gamma-glutamate capsule biosynthesis protein CapA/YwtB (metallophosphatase superfamily)
MKRLVFTFLFLGVAGVLVSFSPERTITIKLAEAPVVSENKSEPLTLLFVGDIMLSRNIGDIITRTRPEFPFEKISVVTRDADVTIGNLEGPISSRGTNQGSEYSFRADPKVTAGLKFAGFDILSLANNHIWDWGTNALIDTVQILEDNDILFVGAGRTELEANQPVFVEKNGVNVAFLSYTNLYPPSLWAKGSNPGVSAWDPDDIVKTIQALERSSDITVVLLHWGEEYKTKASKDQNFLARSFVDAGADLVVGHHPHVVQEVERHGNAWIAYSLGNFVFDQNFDDTRRGLMLRAVITSDGIRSVEPIEIRFTDSFQPYVYEGADNV